MRACRTDNERYLDGLCQYITDFLGICVYLSRPRGGLQMYEVRNLCIPKAPDDSAHRAYEAAPSLSAKMAVDMVRE